MEAFTVEAPPITWAIEGFSGDVENVVIDGAGLITYDIPTQLNDLGYFQINVSGTDANGKVVEKLLCLDVKAPITEPLACSIDLQGDSPGAYAELENWINGDVAFTDVAGTIQATANGQEILNWGDQSTGGTNYTVPAGFDGPDYVLSDIGANGYPVLSFNGVDQSMFFTSPGPTPGDPFNFVQFFNFDSGNTGASPIVSVLPHDPTGNLNLNASLGSWQISRGTGGVVFRYQQSTTGGDFVDITIAPETALFDDNYHLVVTQYDGASITVFIDGDEVLNQVIPVPLLSNHIRLMRNRASNTFTQGVFAELMFDDGTLTDAQITQLQAYLLCKYNLDNSLLSDPGPYSVTNEFYGQLSQYEKHTFTTPVTITLADATVVTGTEFVFDIINGQYYAIDDVPTPGLGLFGTLALEACCGAAGAVQSRTFADAVSVGALDPNNPTETEIQNYITANAIPDGTLYYTGTNDAGDLETHVYTINNGLSTAAENTIEETKNILVPNGAFPAFSKGTTQERDIVLWHIDPAAIGTQIFPATGGSDFFTDGFELGSDNTQTNIGLGGYPVAAGNTYMTFWIGDTWYIKDVTPGTGGGGDNWGTQVAQTDVTLTGDGTVGNELGVLLGTDQVDGQTFVFYDGTTGELDQRPINCETILPAPLGSNIAGMSLAFGGPGSNTNGGTFNGESSRRFTDSNAASAPLFENTTGLPFVLNTGEVYRITLRVGDGTGVNWGRLFIPVAATSAFYFKGNVNQHVVAAGAGATIDNVSHVLNGQIREYSF